MDKGEIGIKNPQVVDVQQFGVLAQLVERLNGIEEVRGSNPLGSTHKSFLIKDLKIIKI